MTINWLQYDYKTCYIPFAIQSTPLNANSLGVAFAITHKLTPPSIFVHSTNSIKQQVLKDLPSHPVHVYNAVNVRCRKVKIKPANKVCLVLRIKPYFVIFYHFITRWYDFKASSYVMPLHWDWYVKLTLIVPLDCWIRFNISRAIVYLENDMK